MDTASKRSKVLTGVVATALAASLLIGGGTFAYLQDETEDLVNNFATNQVTVDLEETTGNDYEIIPGTEKAKDPKVTVNNTVDSYVFVEVTDATDGLVDYTIADGWTLLDGYDNVYYREVAADAEVKEFYVLDGNKVTYDAALQNSDMVDAEGNLKEGLALTFKAYAIQKEPFADAVAAYTMQDALYTDDAIAAKAALGSGQSIVLSGDIDFNDYEETSSASSLYVSRQTATIDLNGKTVTGRSNSKYFNTIKATNNAVITINGDGTVIGGSATTSSTSSNNALEVTKGGKIIVNGGTYTVGADKNGEGNSVVFSNGGDVIINDGFFYTDHAYAGQYWLLNKQDGSNGSIVVYGGTFVNFDPSNNRSEGEGTNYVAEGYVVEQAVQENGDVWYTVVPAQA